MGDPLQEVIPWLYHILQINLRVILAVFPGPAQNLAHHRLCLKMYVEPNGPDYYNTVGI